MLSRNGNATAVKTILGSLALCFATASIAQTRTFELGVQALQDKAKKTDVIVTVKPTDGAAAPTVIKQMQMKSFDTAGTLRWTKNQSDVPATVASGAATTTLSYTDMLRAQPVQTQVLIQTTETVKTEVYKDKVPVQLRPDLSVSTLTTPTLKVRAKQSFNLTATIKELNGDLGATASVALKNGDTQIDNVPQVIVNKLGTAFAVFTAKFDTPGVYTLTAAINSAKPGDYDTSNDSKSITVEVVDDILPSYYGMYQTYREFDYNYSWNDYYGTNITSGKHHDEYGYIYTQSINLTTPIVYPLKMEGYFSVDNSGIKKIQVLETINNPINVVHSDCEKYSYTWKQLSDMVEVYTQSYEGCNGYKYGYAYIIHRAYGGVFYSARHNAQYGAPQYEYNQTNQPVGILLKPQSSVQARLVVTDYNGVSFGGSGELNLSSPYQYDYPLPEGYSGYNRENGAIGSSFGIAAP